MSEPTDEIQQGQLEANNDTLTIRLRNVDAEETLFKIKRSTKLSKVFIRYARDKNVQLTSLRFFFDGERIEEEATPRTLEMEDGDQIDIFLEQTGGIGFQRELCSFVVCSVYASEKFRMSDEIFCEPCPRQDASLFSLCLPRRVVNCKGTHELIYKL